MNEMLAFDISSTVGEENLDAGSTNSRAPSELERPLRQKLAEDSLVGLKKKETVTEGFSRSTQTVMSNSDFQGAKIQSETLLAEWNGYVTSITGITFSAVLTGVFGEGVEGEEEDAIIPVDEVSDDDRDLLQPGGFFRLCIYRTENSIGQKSRVSQTIFRRLPVYRQADLDLASQTADMLLSDIPMD